MITLTEKERKPHLYLYGLHCTVAESIGMAIQ